MHYQNTPSAFKILKVKKNELLEKLRANKESHVKKYVESLATYKANVITALEEIHSALGSKIEDIKSEKAKPDTGIDTFDLHSLKRPKSREKEYQRAIAKMEWAQVDDGLIPLSEDDFNCYVLDEWDWQSDFNSSVTSNARYASSKRR